MLKNVNKFFYFFYFNRFIGFKIYNLFFLRKKLGTFFIKLVIFFIKLGIFFLI
ncbi:hypothetical protein M8044_000270 [Columbia Basin potato purple top phytoplasma]|uniref:Uncharacterized protein n=1 Tax=Columbia Basin potato purple top phytoplasma TaxID=307134 RepID=A0ABT5L8V4_9MOLU|nr:hypothetical protein [Columbia Basin potato purple top phytoplasma]